MITLVNQQELSLTTFLAAVEVVYKLKSKDLKKVFKDYREFVDRDVADFTQQFKQHESGSQNYCSFGNFHY